MSERVKPCERAKPCWHCGKPMGWICGVRGFGVRERTHRVRCFLREVQKNDTDVARRASSFRSAPASCTNDQVIRRQSSTRAFPSSSSNDQVSTAASSGAFFSDHPLNMFMASDIGRSYSKPCVATWLMEHHSVHASRERIDTSDLTPASHDVEETAFPVDPTSMEALLSHNSYEDVNNDVCEGPKSDSIHGAAEALPLQTSYEDANLSVHEGSKSETVWDSVSEQLSACPVCHGSQLLLNDPCPLCTDSPREDVVA